MLTTAYRLQGTPAGGPGPCEAAACMKPSAHAVQRVAPANNNRMPSPHVGLPRGKRPRPRSIQVCSGCYCGPHLKDAAWSISTGRMRPSKWPSPWMPSAQCGPSRKWPAGQEGGAGPAASTRSSGGGGGGNNSSSHGSSSLSSKWHNNCPRWR